MKTLGLIIEIDGKSHEQKEEYDSKRIQYFESLGLKVFVISDLDVKKNIASVMQNIESFIIQNYS